MYNKTLCLVNTTVRAKDNDMKTMLLASILALVFLSACATNPRLDLSPTPVAGPHDPKWISDFDISLMKKQDEVVATHRGSTDSKIILWKNIECMRRVQITQVRAANELMRSQGLSRSKAMSKVKSDPQWFIAEEQCR